MKVTSLKQYKKPKYPLKNEVLHNPILLKKLPERWKARAITSATMSTALLLMLTSCKTPISSQKSTTIQPSSTDQTSSTSTPSTSNQIASTNLPSPSNKPSSTNLKCTINPTAHTAGMMVMPIVNLSEEDALIIINDEAKMQGINFTGNNIVLENIDIPRTLIFENNSTEITTEKSNLTLDGYDINGKIGFEYVSREDIKGWSITEQQEGSYPYNQFSTALSNNLKKADTEKKIGVFYDPKSFDQATAENQLRSQVKEFVNWLKAEGIIQLGG